MTPTDFISPQDLFCEMGQALLARAPAKINLTLLVAGKRPDGFHELETIMAKVTLYDEIRVEPGGRSGIQLVCTGPRWAPEGPDNLVYRAAEALFEATGVTADLRITLTKNIPAGSGLGSASSDAATTLLALNRYLRLNAETGLLAHLAAGLGSDVAFFLGGPLALCTGRGEIVTPLTADFDLPILLVLPDISVSTKRVYENYTHDHRRYLTLHQQIKSRVEGDNSVDFAAGLCVNMLAGSCFELVPALGELKATLESRGTGTLCLSGSGSAMFCLLESTDEATADIPTHLAGDPLNYQCVLVRNNRW